LSDDAGGIQLRLTGDTLAVADRGYDACPQYLLFNFMPENSTYASSYRPDLTLWPCRQDLRQDRIPTCTKAKFDIWNENEVKFTGTYQCFKCFFEGFLTDIGEAKRVPLTASVKAKFMEARGPGYGGTKFTDGVLNTDSARARVQGVYSTVCMNSQNPQGTAVAKTRAGSVGCPFIGTANFTAAWGSPTTITPLLGVMMYAVDDPAADVIKIKPQGAFTPFGAGIAGWETATNPGKWGGWIKYDPGVAITPEAAGR